MTATFETLAGLDSQLATKGHHPLTEWWAPTLERFYAHPTARTLIARVGRGGAKSHTSTKVSLNETLFGDWRVPPGERHLWAFVSLSKDEAAQRLTLIQRFLLDLGVSYDSKGDEIHLRDLPRGWRVMAAQVGAVSGFRCFGRSLDELAKWRNSEGVNPAAEVAASTSAMMVTHAGAGARSLLISSPLGTIDHHAERFDLGDNSEQVIAHAPTWEANPSIAEEQTHALEPDRRVWLREYAAIPQSQGASAFDHDLVCASFRGTPEGRVLRPLGLIDASSGGGDAFAFGVAGYVCAPFQEPVLKFHAVDSIGGRFKGTLTGDRIVAAIAGVFKSHGVRFVAGDQRESLFLRAEFARHGLRFIEIPWTNARKIDAVRAIREHLARRTIVFPDRQTLRREMLNYAERITATGSITYSARGTGHDDEASLVMTCAMAELERMMPGSPLFPQSSTARQSLIVVDSSDRTLDRD